MKEIQEKALLVGLNLTTIVKKNDDIDTNESMEELGMEMDALFQEEAFTKQMDLPQMNLADWAFDTSVIEELKLRIVDLFAGTMTPEQAADSVAAVAAEVIGE